MRTAQEVLQELMDNASIYTDTDYENAIEEFKVMLDDSPIKPLAHAGIGYCKAKLGYAPFTVMDYFTIALTYNSQNPITWELLADYSRSMVKKCSFHYRTPEFNRESDVFPSQGLDRYEIPNFEKLPTTKPSENFEELSLELPEIKKIHPLKPIGIFAGLLAITVFLIAVFDK